MATVSRERFLDLLKRSRLVTDEQLSEVLSARGGEEDAESLAQRLMDAGLINEWHVENLFKEKYKGFTLGKYKLLGHLGTGGMSSVFLAQHPVMERLVAIKVLPKHLLRDQNYLDRFKREARAAAALDHPNIVRAYDIDQDGDRHYIVMEYVEGQDLQRIVKEHGPCNPLDAADYTAQAALGLQHAHDAGLIHRDVKPANCLLDNKGVVKLLDMGLAKFSQDDRPALSAIYDDSVVGTADYLAPEQALNSQKVDSRADIYSLGCTMYFLLTAQPPFPEGSIAERLLKHQTAEPTSIYNLRPDAPPVLVELCRRMMIKSREDRIQFASVVAEELAAWMRSRGRSVTYERAAAGAAATRTTDSSVRWTRQRPTRFGPTPAPGFTATPNVAGETVPSSKGDTVRIPGSDSSVSDDLTLAPLDEELAKERKRKEREAAAAEGSNLLDRAPDKSSTGSSIDEVDLEKYGIPLDRLLADEAFARKQAQKLPKTHLTKPKPPEEHGRWIAIAVVAGLVGFAGLVTLLTFLIMR